ncbi:hypothetical protein E4633_19400 [Geomonas terrae]|uniref:Uncharacterized protein n=1 Tax=Geomonas terrae TaxID=2562681 RepID=A0A4S1CAM5_9BACT|nr:hypothetical protein [Geomonas terrae]TGU70355.1 hypothetical protein E4633_19400 [Geomonas terrae]
MSARLQSTCGYGGTRLKRILVCADHELRPPVPTWLRLFVALVLATVALCVSRFQMPGVPVSKRTIMDVSKLDLKAPPVQPKKLAPPMHPVAEKVQRQRTVYALDAKPPQYNAPAEEGRRPEKTSPGKAAQRHEASYPSETPYPVVARSYGYQSGSEVSVSPVVTRERQAAEGFEPAAGSAGTPTTRLRKEATAEVGARPSTKSTYIYRMRGGPTAALPSASEPALSPQRPTRPVEAAASAPVPRVAAVRSAPEATIEEPKAKTSPAARERSKSPAGSAAAGSDVSLSRGVSLMSLKICDSALQQEEAIKSVLSVVGSRHSCTSDKGEFQFKGTKRVSSFNLIIFPSRGREPSQRCEELEYAYDCLRKN